MDQFPSARLPYRNAHRLNQQLNAIDINQSLDVKLAQLTALLTVITGEGTTCFHTQPEGIKGLYLLACSEMAQDCLDIAETISKA